jgi:dipeptidyl aminopeptidase/acylaminoacyl peptidase
MSDTVFIDADRGRVKARWDAAGGSRTALLMVGGGDGGFDGPADALYPTLAEDAAARGWAALRVDFRIHRFPNSVPEGLHDVFAGLAWLRDRGYDRVGLIGHSFGGAVVIEAAARVPEVCSVVTLATQTGGVRSIERLAKPLLLIHGADDVRLHPDCSRQLYALAPGPKELVIIEGARHSLRQAREEVRRRILEWFDATLPEE